MRGSAVVLGLLTLATLSSSALVRPDPKEHQSSEGSRGNQTRTGLPELRIIGGQSINDDSKYPWMSWSDGSFPRCGLAVIHKRWVLTASHCVLNKWETGFVAPSSGQRIHFHCTNTGSRSCIDRHPVMIKPHPCFDPCCDVHDIALIKVNQDMPPPYAPIDGLNENIEKDIEEITMMGWGSTCGSGGCVPHQLQHLTVKTTTDQVCKDKNPTRNGINEGYCGKAGKCPNLFTDGSVFCSGGEQGKDSCNGDSGAPVIWTDPDNPDRVVVAGVVILGSEIPTDDGKCGAAGRVSVLTKVRDYAYWINQTIETDGNAAINCENVFVDNSNQNTVSGAQPLSPSIALLIGTLSVLGVRGLRFGV